MAAGSGDDYARSSIAYLSFGNWRYYDENGSGMTISDCGDGFESVMSDWKFPGILLNKDEVLAFLAEADPTVNVPLPQLIGDEDFWTI